jgi:hypothetical protein
VQHAQTQATLPQLQGLEAPSKSGLWRSILCIVSTTKTGLRVESVLDTRNYQKGIKISKAAMKCLDIIGDQFHPEWNYTIRPRPPKS